jgi:HSP20 family protein
MPSTSTDPFEPRQAGEKVRHELEKLVETVWSRSERALDAMGLSGMVGHEMQPRLDVTETETAVEIVADIPGIDPDAVNISLAGNMLTLSGSHPLRDTSENNVVHSRERPAGDFSRSVPLPCAVDVDGVTATAKNGVLEITLKKPEAEQVHQIQIRVKSRESETAGNSQPD